MPQARPSANWAKQTPATDQARSFPIQIRGKEQATRNREEERKRAAIERTEEEDARSKKEEARSKEKRKLRRLTPPCRGANQSRNS